MRYAVEDAMLGAEGEEDDGGVIKLKLWRAARGR